MKKEILCKPFTPDQIKTRPGQHGKVLSYIETHAVIARLNEGCDAWGFELVKDEIVEDEVIVVGKLVADGVIKMAFGGATITRDREGRIVDLGDTHKAAASDALKKAASLLGVGLELYGGVVGTSAPSADTPRPTTLTSLTTDRRRPPTEGDRLTSRQLAAIHAVARRRGLGGPQVSAMLLQRWGCEGPQHLTRKEASDFISELSGTNGANSSS